MSILGTAIAADERNLSLIETLRYAVPLQIEELQRLHPGGMPLYKSKDDAAAIGTYSDTLMFPGHGERSPSGRRSVTKAFNGLARGLAAMAISDADGVTFAGLHWCTRAHENCPTPPRKPGPPVTDVEIKEVIALLDEYEAMLPTPRRKMLPTPRRKRAVA